MELERPLYTEPLFHIDPKFKTPEVTIVKVYYETYSTHEIPKVTVKLGVLTKHSTLHQR